MGQSQTKVPQVCSEVQWQLSTASAVHFPSLDDIEAVLLTSPHTSALGKDVCTLIASYCPCLAEEAVVTSSGLILPLTPPYSTSSISLRPPLPSHASCYLPLPPSSLAFGLNDSTPAAQTDRRRALIHIYDAHSFSLSHTLYFPYQTEFLSPHPSVSSLLLLPPAFPLPLSSSSLLVGLDDVGHLCIWHWRGTGQLLYSFDTRPPVFYASSALCALPYGRLALLLTACPGPQHPPSRLHVFDLTSEREYSAVDSELHSLQVFPVSLFFPSPVQSGTGQTSPTTASAAKAKSLPYSLYSNDSLSRWHIQHTHEAVEVRPVILPPLSSSYSSSQSTSPSFSPPLPSYLFTSSTPWQALGHSNPLNSYRWRHRCKAIRWDTQGRVVHVEGGVGVVRVWIGHHIDRFYTGSFDFQHDDTDTAADDPPSDGDSDGGGDENKQPHDDRPVVHSEEEERKAPATRPPRLTAPILIPRVPFAVPPLLLYNRRPRQRRSPPNLHVSAAFTASGMLIISAHHPGHLGGDGRGRIVKGWRLVRGNEGEAVKGVCVVVKRMTKNADVGFVLSGDAPAKMAQRKKDAKQFFLG